MKIQFEAIYPPINLEITTVTNPFIGYKVSFLSENREFGFTGYRLYIQKKREDAINQQIQEFNLEKAFTQKTGWCSSIQANTNFLKRLAIQISADPLIDGYYCLVKDLVFRPGFYLAIRAGVNRDCQNIASNNCFPWSKAASAQIP